MQYDPFPTSANNSMSSKRRTVSAGAIKSRSVAVAIVLTSVIVLARAKFKIISEEISNEVVSGEDSSREQLESEAAHVTSASSHSRSICQGCAENGS
jgi:hypothetical protein